MALETNELFSGLQRGPSIRMAAEHSAVKTIGLHAGAPLLPIGLPLYFDTVAATWKSWVVTKTIDAFIYFQTEITGTTTSTLNIDPAVGTVVQGIQTSATEEVHGVVMTHGIIHRDDIPIPAGESQATLDAALKLILKSGLVVQGLVDTH
jgi:hypothetical protein